MIRTCHNCGMPEWAQTKPGLMVKITPRPTTKFKQTHSSQVWCHNEDCAIQAIAVATWGPSIRWPMTLAEFKRTNPLGKQQNPPARRSLEYKQAQMARRTLATGKTD